MPEGNRIAMASLAVLAIYVLIAALDSVSWRNAERDEAGRSRLIRRTADGVAAHSRPSKSAAKGKDLGLARAARSETR
jgi:hypothetical protein